MRKVEIPLVIISGIIFVWRLTPEEEYVLGERLGLVTTSVKIFQSISGNEKAPNRGLLCGNKGYLSSSR